MKSTKFENIKNPFDPLDLVEDIISNNDWDFERDKNKIYTLKLEVSGVIINFLMALMKI